MGLSRLAGHGGPSAFVAAGKDGAVAMRWVIGDVSTSSLAQDARSVTITSMTICSEPEVVNGG